MELSEPFPPLIDFIFTLDWVLGVPGRGISPNNVVDDAFYPYRGILFCFLKEKKRNVSAGIGDAIKWQCERSSGDAKKM